MTDLKKWCFAFAFVVLVAALSAPAQAQLTPVSFAPAHTFGAFGTTDGNGGAFFAESIAGSMGLYNKTVATFSGSDNTGKKCAIFKPSCSATSTVVNGFEKIVAQTADGRWTATCDGEAGISTSGSSTGFSWGGGCHGWFRVKPTGSLFVGFSPRWTKDNVGPNSGKLTFNFDLMHVVK